MVNKVDERFWKTRSKGYNKLKWVNDKSFIKALLKFANFSKNNLVLDVGTGTGIIADAIAPNVMDVIGIDISRDMLKYGQWDKNKYFVRLDIRDKFFHNNVFDKVVARMVFHHILKDTQAAMNNCYNTLKHGGRFIIIEGVPPHDKLKDEFSHIFALKEKRNVFLKNDLIDIMKKSGFKNIKEKIFIMKNFSVKNWLENSGLSKYKQQKIFNLHINSSILFKKEYNLKIVNNDCLIDVKDIMLMGEK